MPGTWKETNRTFPRVPTDASHIARPNGLLRFIQEDHIESSIVPKSSQIEIYCLKHEGRMDVCRRDCTKIHAQIVLLEYFMKSQHENPNRSLKIILVLPYLHTQLSNI